ncbi:MAG: hypothetical protein ACOY4O_03230 [Pseudomonadota bacterium]
MVLPTRLRQVCLVVANIEPAATDIPSVMGLNICYRDPNVGRFGLENILIPVGDVLLEVVAPIREGTAAGRFVEKTQGRGGYMAILSCEDPRERGKNAEAMGVRTAHLIDRHPYLGVQLHPRDCRGAFIEFNHTANSDNLLGPYPPAGPDWHKAIRKDVTQALTAITMESPDPAGLAAHWSKIIGYPATNGAVPEVRLPNATIRFIKGSADLMSGLTFKVTDPDAVLSRAKAKGLPVKGNVFALSGVDFEVTA